MKNSWFNIPLIVSWRPNICNMDIASEQPTCSFSYDYVLTWTKTWVQILYHLGCHGIISTSISTSTISFNVCP